MSVGHRCKLVGDVMGTLDWIAVTAGILNLGEMAVGHRCVLVW